MCKVRGAAAAPKSSPFLSTQGWMEEEGFPHFLCAMRSHKWFTLMEMTQVHKTCHENKSKQKRRKGCKSGKAERGIISLH